MEDPGPEASRDPERHEPGPSPRRPPAGAARRPRTVPRTRPTGTTTGPRLVSRTVRLDDGLDPLELAADDGFVWSAPDGAVVGAGVAARVPVGTGPGRIERAAEAVAARLAAVEVDDPAGPGPAAVGSLPFSSAVPGELVVPGLLLRTGRDGATWAVLTAPDPFDPPSAAELLARLRAAVGPRPWPPARRLDRPGPTGEGLWTGGASQLPAAVASPTGGLGAGPGRSGLAGTGGLEGWRAAVRAALAEIEAGRLDKVVLAREALVEAERPFPRTELLRRLRRRPGGATFLYADGGFVGASPELLVRRRGRVATSRPMAGTVPRGDSAAAEAAGLARLTTSPKEAVEHRLVVDAVAEGLAKVADRVQVGRPEVVRLATVAHLATEVTADLTGPLPTALELAGLLHPTPAVGGSPRDAALAAIATLEPFDRGGYAGPVGWVDRAGDGEWAVALRCATLDGARARLLAGAGIVPGSDPDAEWAETEDKLRAILDVLLTR
jgi:menaquinone-specific isochorismate synthase